MDTRQPPTIEQLSLGEYAQLLAEANAATVEARALMRKTHDDLEEAQAVILELEAKIVDHAEPAEADLGEHPPIGGTD